MIQYNNIIVFYTKKYLKETEKNKINKNTKKYKIKCRNQLKPTMYKIIDIYMTANKYIEIRTVIKYLQFI